MSVIEASTQLVLAGVDTHQATHHCAVIDSEGRLLADRGFPANGPGYRQLLDWVAGHGLVQAIGVESTSGYGAGLTRHLLVAGVEVYEVSRPEKATRAMQGKSDPIDAACAARQVLTGKATARPKITSGVVEALRMIKIPRDSAVRDRTRAYSQLRDLITTAPTVLHDELIGLSSVRRVTKAAGLRPDTRRLEDPVQAARAAMRTLARRIQSLSVEIAEADRIIDRLTTELVPSLRGMPGVGPQSAAQLVITAGQNIGRMRNEAAFAKLTGTAPLPASSGKRNNRHRLNPGGDRQANSALHMIVINRLSRHQPTRDYYARRQGENLGNLDIIRCLKRHLARSIFRALRNDLMRT